MRNSYGCYETVNVDFSEMPQIVYFLQAVVEVAGQVISANALSCARTVT